MNKFKVGDKVKLIGNHLCTGEPAFPKRVGEIGVIIGVDDTHYPCHIRFSDGYVGIYIESDIELYIKEEQGKFSTGAYRDGEKDKNDYEGFISPLVLESFGNYMTKHRKQSNGEYRDSDNWKKGIDMKAYMRSTLRHIIDLWKIHEGYKIEKEGHIWDKEEILNAVLFNIMGMQYENIKDKYEKMQ